MKIRLLYLLHYFYRRRAIYFGFTNTKVTSHETPVDICQFYTVSSSYGCLETRSKIEQKEVEVASPNAVHLFQAPM